MDIFFHALAGAAAGSVFGHPFVGAITAVCPDVVLGLQRRNSPSVAYRYTHSILTALCVAAGVALLPLPVTVALAVAVAWVSHLVLDIPTHGAVWAPRLFYPFTQFYFKGFTEWEFRNRAWYNGAILTLIWMLICLAISHV